MTDEKKDGTDLDYILLTAAMAGGLAALGTVVTLLARPMLKEIGRQLPLPTIEEILSEKEE